ncbi:MAG: GAF domain-containing protein [Spirochaetes bacterium]|jgi:HD-GYP domain-containing protein (c-di-GMP phosphodiesterase class II)|nr:GAF domain-containing protein [Spirochaetota bacterium]
MKKIVVISKKVGDCLMKPVSADYQVILTDDVKWALKELLDDVSGAQLFAVIFCLADESGGILDFLSDLSHIEIIYRLVVFGTLGDLKNFKPADPSRISEFRCSPLGEEEFVFTVEKTLSVIGSEAESMKTQDQYLNKLIDTRLDQEDLINIGKSLSSEKNTEKLLRLILFMSKKITGADAGSIYLVEDDPSGKKMLRFKYSNTFSREVPLEEFVMDMNKKSISGYTAVTGEVLNIPDAYSLPPDAPYSFNSSFDKTHNYRSQSMLVIPMRNHVDEIIGVIQLINSKESMSGSNAGNEAFTLKLETPEDFENYVVPFNERYNNLMEAIACQAAVAIENSRLIEQIQNQFEEFVRASVTAIESRDPATSGHSFRVAEICMLMASAINEEKEGYLGSFNFTESEMRELEYAALLHDFGKVYIDLSVFRKAKKLYPKDFDNLCLRLNYLYRFLELKYSGMESMLLKSLGKSEDSIATINNLLKEKNDKLDRIKFIKEKLTQMNEPSVMEDEPAKVLAGLCEEVDEVECINMDGYKIEVIPETHRVNLSIKRGSLNSQERKEIESHVIHSYNFLSKIPWPPEYRRIPEITLRHHEKINGTGYPDGLSGRESTLIQSRIMAVADIYDALIAHDRPYKKAIPLDKVLAILRDESERGVLDPDLVELFIFRKIYEKVGRDSFRNEEVSDAV